MKVSVLTPTVRLDGLKLIEKSLKRQTFRNFEWIIGSPIKPELSIPFKWSKDPEKNQGDYWVVYKSYNNLVRLSDGDLIVSWQDYTYAIPEALERLVEHYLSEPSTICGGVGNKYADDSFTVMTWKDPREKNDGDSYTKCGYNEIELNFCAFPRKVIYDVGGFDEDLDKYSSLCGLDVLARASIVGSYGFKLDQTIKHFSLEHGRLDNWSKNEPFNGPWQTKLRSYMENPRLNYLSLNNEHR